MKRIVNGVTYNTDTSVKIGRYCFENDDNVDCVATLYQTRGGAFFEVEEGAKKVWNQREQKEQAREYSTVTPMSVEQAQKWILEIDNVEIFQNPFGDPPEAAAEDSPGATIYVRVPESFKRRIEREATENKASVNNWMMRCAERCMEDSDIRNAKGLVHAWDIAATFRAHNNDGEWSRETCIEALAEVANLIERYCEDRFGTDALANATVDPDSTLESYRKRFEAYASGETRE
ncbi:hypothetical protein CCR97_19035 [Rhodoplanes elegans]|uniref:Arc-like DNA binding domain-containing protein n=1 Tax=Rhodoplanes elegans TaxID=29408 RepID=A0A327KZA4_9BRAD|nr:hypothetical protein [Rhodoplanes elegans]MBK5960280.1 hypothetical protein [Rhodoplanes elegans]RAI40728.1 hypothetical protein CH338_05420 [Rhodoplanes elegans]